MKGKVVTAMKRPWLVHAVAVCYQCGWRYEDYLGDFVSEAKKHTKETGHETGVETGYCQHYSLEREE
jgi:hypothetical protein